MLLSRAAEVALAALPYLDGRGPLAPGRGVKELAGTANLRAPFLAKVLQRLVERGVLRSKRGRTGGFVLGRPASEITVADVVLAGLGATAFLGERLTLRIVVAAVAILAGIALTLRR